MSMNNHGFLSNDINQVKKKNKEMYSDIFVFFIELNLLLHKSKNKIEFNKENLQSLVVTGFYLKCIHAYSSIYYLCEMGLVLDAEATCRNMIESVLYMKACHDNATFTNKYIQLHERGKIKSINKILNSAKDRFQIIGIKKKELESLRDNAKNEVSRIDQIIGENDSLLKIDITAVEQVAKIAGLMSLYDYPYSLFSKSVHSSPSTIDRFFKYDDDGNVKYIDWILEDSSISRVMIQTIAVLFRQTCMIF